MSTTRVRFLLCDDHKLVAPASARSSTPTYPRVVSEAWSGDEAVEKAAALTADVVVMDVRVPSD
jgi:DNA-binding NarL/FixJ family response regulator